MAGKPHPSEGADTRLVASKDRQLGFRWPLALDQRLDALVERANDAGEKANRREVLAALLLAADPSGEQLGAMLRAFRTATVAEAILDADIATVFEFPVHKPGPRTLS